MNPYKFSSLLENLKRYKLLCEGVFNENNINKNLEIYDLNTFFKTGKSVSMLEVVCVASVVEYPVVSKFTKFFVIPTKGDQAPVKIADISTYQAEYIHKIKFDIKTNQNKIITSAERVGARYVIYVLEHKIIN